MPETFIPDQPQISAGWLRSLLQNGAPETTGLGLSARGLRQAYEAPPPSDNVVNRRIDAFAEPGATNGDLYARDLQAHMLDYERQQQAKIGQAAGRMPGLMAQGLLDIPRRAFEESERLRTTGEYDPEPVMSAAGLAMTGGIPFAPRGAVGAFGGKLPPGKAAPVAANENILSAENLAAKAQEIIAANPELSRIARERPAAFNDIVQQKLKASQEKSDQNMKEHLFKLGPNPTREEFERWALRPIRNDDSALLGRPEARTSADAIDKQIMADFQELLSGSGQKPKTEFEVAQQASTKKQGAQEHAETSARLENRLGPVLNMTEAQANSLDRAGLQALHKQVQEYELAMKQLRPMIPELLRNGLTMPQIVKMDPSQAYKFVQEHRTGSGRVNRESDKEIGDITNSLNSVRRWVSDRLLSDR